MTRQTDPKSKLAQIIIRAKNPDEETKIRAMKEIIFRNPELTITTSKNKKGEGIKLIERFLAAHNWPPGNSQTLMSSFTQTRITQKCDFPSCEEYAIYECVPKSKYAKPKVFFCQGHYEEARDKGLLKSVKPLKK